MKVELLSRAGCGLCVEVEKMLHDLAIPFVTVDIDGNEALYALYREHIPVVLLDGREVARAPLSPERLREIFADAAAAKGR